MLNSFLFAVNVNNIDTVSCLSCLPKATMCTFDFPLSIVHETNLFTELFLSIGYEAILDVRVTKENDDLT
jgi:hypothetical protein